VEQPVPARVSARSCHHHPRHRDPRDAALSLLARAAALAFTLLAVGLFAGKSQTFIYFQF
jgi:hypothetical protein